MPKAGERSDYEEPRIEELQDELAEEEKRSERRRDERDELIRAIQADHRAKASLGGSPCICKWCKRR